MQIAMGLALIGLSFFLIKLTAPNAAGIAPAFMESWFVAIAVILLFTVLSALGFLLILFSLTGVSTI